MSVIALAILTKQKLDQSAEHSYRKREGLFSSAERSFLGVLNQAVGEKAIVLGKVRVADVIEPEKGPSRSDWQKSFNKISAKHFDFLLCNRNDLSLLCVIELNDSSHNSKKRKNRDAFLEAACQSADLPLIQITAKSTYNIKEIQKSLLNYIPSKPSSEIEATEHVAKVSNNEKTCPKCSSKLVKKVAKKGENIGNEFWACSAFPKCRHTETINA